MMNRVSRIFFAITHIAYAHCAHCPHYTLQRRASRTWTEAEEQNNRHGMVGTELRICWVL